MFGISGAEFLVLAVVAALVLGPKNVAQILYALKKAVASLRSWSEKLREESAGVVDVGLSKEDLEKFKGLDVRQLDPRNIVREAVQEEMKAWLAAMEKTSADIRPTAQVAASATQASAVAASATAPEVQEAPSLVPGHAAQVPTQAAPSSTDSSTHQAPGTPGAQPLGEDS